MVTKEMSLLDESKMWGFLCFSVHKCITAFGFAGTVSVIMTIGIESAGRETQWTIVIKKTSETLESSYKPFFPTSLKANWAPTQLSYLSAPAICSRICFPLSSKARNVAGGGNTLQAILSFLNIFLKMCYSVRSGLGKL